MRFGKMLAMATVAFAMPLAAQAATVTFADFSDTTGLTLVGNAGVVGGNVLRLTPSAPGQSGAAYSTTAVELGVDNTFSTVFQFRLSQPGGIAPADGITFVLAASSNGLGGAGGGLGYAGVGNSVAIEFDTFNNGEIGGSNHVGVDVNGSLASLVSANPYGVTTCDFGSGIGPGCMSNGSIWTATIGYNGTALSLRLREGNGLEQTLINNYAINLSNVIGTNMAFVGFTGATGSGYENQDILNWSFSNTTALAEVPEPATWALMIGGFGMAGGALRRRRAAA